MPADPTGDPTLLLINAAETKFLSNIIVSFTLISFELDPSKYLFTKNNEPVQLTTIEFALMKLLMQHAGQVLKRDDILRSIWGEEVYVTPRTVDTHIANLRRKIEDDPEQSRWITGIRGVGYKLNTYESSRDLNQT